MGSMSFSQFLFSFEGRINRSAYWLKWTLPYLVVYLVLFIISMALAPAVDAAGNPMTAPSAASTAMNAILGLFSLVALWPSLAVAAKRWHDRDKSGWWTLIVLVPLIGSIWMLIECGFLKGTTGPTGFGQDPLQTAGGMPQEPVMEPQM